MINYGNKCLTETSDTCVLYTGPDFPSLGVVSGEQYSILTVKLLNVLVEHIEQQVDLKCLYTGTCDTCSPTVTIPNAVQVIIDAICSLKDSDIAYTGNSFCLTGDTITENGAPLQGRNIDYFVDTVNNTTTFGFDFTEASKGLPAGYRATGFQTQVSGVIKDGKSVIGNYNKKTLSVNINNDRFPITADFTLRVNTPGGDVDLKKVIVIPSSTSKTYTSPLFVRDYTNGNAEVTTQRDFNNVIAAAVCGVQADVDRFKNLNVAQCGDVVFPSGELSVILGVLAGRICALEKQLAQLNNLTISTVIDGCSNQVTNGTAQEVLAVVEESINSLNTQVGNIGTFVGCPGGTCSQ